jgi:hypothetical protein
MKGAYPDPNATQGSGVIAVEHSGYPELGLRIGAALDL